MDCCGGELEADAFMFSHEPDASTLRRHDKKAAGTIGTVLAGSCSVGPGTHLDSG